MARPPIKKRPSFKQTPADSASEALDKKLDKQGYGYDFIIGRDTRPVKPPTKKELDRMRQRQIIRKYPTKSI